MDFFQLCCLKNVVNKVKKVVHTGLKAMTVTGSLETAVEEFCKNCKFPPALTDQVTQIFHLSRDHVCRKLPMKVSLRCEKVLFVLFFQKNKPYFLLQFSINFVSPIFHQKKHACRHSCNKHAKSQSIPVEAWTGPEDNRMLSVPDFKTIGT